MEFTLECPVYNSYRVQEIGGMFDVSIEKKALQHFKLDDPPPLSDDWQIGLIVGPSGSGKSTVAKRVYGDSLFSQYEWPDDKSVIDSFPKELKAKEIVRLFTLVGFSSPPSWIKPYSVLSNGEKFRCDLAMVLAQGKEKEDTETPLIVFDEFTSVVDRTVGMAVSTALAKAIRSEKVKRRFVAVTCHYDVAQWLEADWVLDMATGKLERRRLRREPIHVKIFRCEKSAWELFKRHHYLSGSLSPAATCYMATIDDNPVGFVAILHNMGQKNYKRISRIVILPDYQGLGIGMKLAEAVGDLYKEKGIRFGISASHPSVINHCKRSPFWKARSYTKCGTIQKISRKCRSAVGRAIVGFEYLGDPKKRLVNEKK